MMHYHLVEGGRHHNLSRSEGPADESFSGQYIRFCPTDAWKPHINVYETQDALVVCVDLAGVKPGSVQVDLRGEFLVLRGARPRPVPDSAGRAIGIRLMEIDTGAFCREIEVPASVDRGKMTVTYREGLLWITLPTRT